MLKFKHKDGMIHLEGTMGELADYSKLLEEPSPLRLNLKNVKAVNSHGARKWIEFIIELEGPYEFHECSQVFVELANMIPTAISPTGNARPVKSVVLIYRCIECEKRYETIFPLQHSAGKVEIAFPTPSCPRCKLELDPEFDEDGFFLFLEG